VEDAEDAHHAGPGVLDAVHLLRRQMEAGADRERDRRVPDVREPLALDDVADLVVAVAVVRRAAGLDDADELRRVHTPCVLVDEVPEGALRIRTQLGAIGEADDDLPRRAIDLLDGNGRRDDQELVGATVLDGVRLARPDVDAAVRLQRVSLALELERSRSRDDVEELVAIAAAARMRAAGGVARHPLLEQRGASLRTEDHLFERRVALEPPSLDVGLGDHECLPHGGNLTCWPLSCQQPRPVKCRVRLVHSVRERRRGGRPPPYLPGHERDDPAPGAGDRGRPRDQLRDPRGRALRPARPERRREDDDDQDADDAAPPDGGKRTRARLRRRARCARGACTGRVRVRGRPRPLRAALRTRQPALLRGALRGRPAAPAAADRRAALSRRPRRTRARARRGLQPRHAAAAAHRPRPAPRPARPLPRRADDRPGPRRREGAAGTDRLAHPGREDGAADDALHVRGRLPLRPNRRDRQGRDRCPGDAAGAEGGRRAGRRRRGGDLRRRRTLRAAGRGAAGGARRHGRGAGAEAAADRADGAGGGADPPHPRAARRRLRRSRLDPRADARGRLRAARHRVRRLVRVIGLGLVLQFKHLTRNPFDLMTTAIWPLVYASLAYFMFRAGNEPASLLLASLGATMMGIWSVTTVGAADAIQRQRWAGVLELLVAAPTPFWAVLIPITIATSAIGVYSLVSTLLWGRFLFGIPIHLEQPLIFALAIIPTIVSIGLLGFLMASVVVRFRAGWAVGNMFEYPVWIVTGLLIPVALLPGWAEPVSWVLAPTWGMRALSDAAFVGGSPVFDIVMCVVLGVAYIVIGAVLLDRFLESARRRATLSLT